MRHSRSGSALVTALLLAGLAIGSSAAAAVPGPAATTNTATSAASLTALQAALTGASPQLAAADGQSYELFGSAVALSGDSAIIGAPHGWGAGGEYQGAAYIFTGSGGSWTQQAKLVAGDGDAYHWFGSSVAISGDTALVGAPDHDSAYVFTRSGATWTQQAQLTVAGVSGFGASAALDGGTALVGGGGSVYVFTGSGSSWSRQATLSAGDGTAIGTSVSLSGDTALAGAPSWNTEGVNGGMGAAYVFVRSGDSWSQQAMLRASGGAYGDYFGQAVAVAGDTALVGPRMGSVGSSINQGYACVFVRSGGVWTQQAQLLASDGADYDCFGRAVALSGDTALVGAPWTGGNGTPANSHGSAYVFLRSGQSWTQRSKMTTSAWDPWFGAAVAVSSGETALIGAPYDDVGIPSANVDQGSAYAFSLDATPPVTACDRVPYYADSATIHLTATDTGGSGVDHTYYTINGGTRVESSTALVSVAGTYTLRFWSIDVAGNTETAHAVSFTVIRKPAANGTPSTPGPIPALRHGRTFTTFGYVIRHTAGTYPVTLLFSRYQSGHWVLRKSITAKASDMLTFSKYSRSTSVPYAGKWRVRARHKVGTQYLYSGYRTFTAS